MKMSYSSPENHEASVRLAHAMYEHIAKAGQGGLPFPDVVAAACMVAGMLLSGAYEKGAKRDAAARAWAGGALEYALRCDGLPRVPMGHA